MGKRLLAALRSYALPWYVWAAVVAVALATPAFLSRGQTWWEFGLYYFLMGNSLIGSTVGGQLRLQFGSAAARLIPGFALPHLLIAGGIVSAAMLLETLGLAGIAGLSALAIAGASLFLLSTLACCAYRHGGLGIALNGALMVSLVARVSFPPAARPFVLGQAPLWAAGLLVLGIAELVALLLWVRGLHEERADYPRLWPRARGPKSRSLELNAREGVAQRIARATAWTSWLWDLQFQWIVRGEPSGYARRRRLLQAMGVFVLLAPLEFAITLVLWKMPNSPQADVLDVLLPLLLPAMILSSVLFPFWMQRWSEFGQEWLFPQSRADWVRHLIRGGGWDALAAGIGNALGVVVGWSFVDSHDLGAVHIACCLAIVMLLHRAIGYVVMWIVSFRSVWIGCPAAVAVTLGVFAAGMPLLVAGVRLGPLLGLAAVAGLAAILAAGTYRLAFQRWCRVELG